VSCGFVLNRACAACGMENPSEAKFCNECGTALVNAARSSHAAPQWLGHYPHRSPTTQGERRQVTVLFADLKGSFELIYGLDPEDAQQLLSSVIEAMITAVHRYEGVVNQVMGDGIMALFGAPIAHEDHAVRAAAAARAMHNTVAALPDLRARGAASMIRVGLNSGEVLVHSGRNDLSPDYRAIGTTTHLAARMEQLATPGTVWLTEATLRLGFGQLNARDLGYKDVRGAAEPIRVFELLGIKERTRFLAAVRRGLSPFTGRAEVAGQLRNLLSHTRRGACYAAIVVGEPGIGKSRLCFEVVTHPDAKAFRIIEVPALAFARRTPHALMAALLRALLDLNDLHAPQQIAQHVREQLVALECGDEATLAAALGLLDLSAGIEWQKLEPLQRRVHIDRCVRAVLSRIVATQPLVLVLEDMHWSDGESLQFFVELMTEPPPGPLFLMLTHRSDFETEWPVAGHVVQLALEKLPPDKVEAFLIALLGEDPSLHALRRRLSLRSGGNPFFIEEMVYSLRENGTLVGTWGQLRLSAKETDTAIPSTVEAVIAARLDRLPTSALTILQIAAAIGDESPNDILSYVAALEPNELSANIERLANGDFLYRSDGSRAPSYRFRHALIREVAYRQMVKTRRKQLHARICLAFEQLYASRLMEYVERLAEQSCLAELWEKSTEYSRRAVRRAAGLWANEQALGHLERGLETLGHVAAGAEHDVLAIDLRLAALAALLPLGEHERLIAMLGEAEACARALDDRRRLCKIYNQLATELWLTARHDEALEKAAQARRLSEELSDEALLIQARNTTAMIHHARGELHKALNMLVPLSQELVGDKARRTYGWAGYPSLFVSTFIISSSTLLGDFRLVDATYRDARPLADELKHPYCTTMVLEEYAFSLLVRGEAERARELLELALTLCEENMVVIMRTPIVARLGAALLECGDATRARELLQHELDAELYRSAGHYGLDYLLISLAEAQLRTGDLELALTTAQRAECTTAEVGEHGYHVCALITLARVLCGLPGHEQQAEKVFVQAREKSMDLHMAPFEAFAREGLAQIHSRSGDNQAAASELREAARLWGQLGAGVRASMLAVQQASLAAQRAG